MAGLYPTFSVPKMTKPEKDRRNRDVYSINFDFEKGGFVLDKGGVVEKADPYKAWAQWCLKTVYTERGAHYAYSDAIGTEKIAAFQENTKAAQESAFERTITEALLADPYNRTVYVNDFSFDRRADGLHISFTVGSVWDTQERLEVVFGEGRKG